MYRRLVATYGAILTSQLLSLVSLTASIRILGNETNGQLVFSYYLVATVVSIAVIGQRTGNIHASARRSVAPKVLLSNAVVYALTIGGLASAIVLILPKLAPHGPWSVIPSATIPALAGVIPCLLLRELALAMTRGRGDYFAFNLNRPLVELARLVVVVSLGLTGGASAAFIISSVFVAEACVAVAICISTWRRHSSGFRPDWQSFVKTQHISRMAAIVVALSLFHRNIDKFLLTWLLDDGAVALTSYHIAVASLAPLSLLANTVSSVAFPSLSRADPETAQTILPQLLRTLVFVALLFLGVLALLARPLLPLFFGVENISSYTTMLLLGPGVAALVLSTCVTSYLSSQRQFLYWIGVGAASLVLNIAMNLILIPLFSIQGAAMATSISYIFEAVALIGYFTRIRNIPLTEVLIVRTADFQFLRQSFRLRTTKSNSGTEQSHVD